MSQPRAVMNKVQLPRAFVTAGGPAAISPSLSPHKNAQIESWSCRGRFAGASLGERAFVFSLFRYRADGDCGSDGLMCLICAQDPTTGARNVTSRVSPQLIEQFGRQAPAQLRQMGMPGHLADAFAREISECGPPQPIEVGLGSPPLSDAVLEILWGDIAFRQDGGLFELTVPIQHATHLCRMRLVPAASWLTAEAIGGKSDCGDGYVGCPRLDVKGTIGDEAIEGVIWLEQRWGGWPCALGGKREKEAIGWESFRFNLTGDLDLLLVMRRGMKSRDALPMFGALMGPDGARRLRGPVRAHVLHEFTGPKSHAVCPIGWRLEIPEIDAELVFEPLAEDSEIPVFGVVNAIWEGAGRVRGRLAGTDVRGHGFLELNGYGHLLDLDRLHEIWTRRIDAHIARELPKEADEKWLTSVLGPPTWRYDSSAHTAMLLEPAHELLSRRGKHWRPIFGMLMLEALGAPVEPSARMVSVIPELGHTGSLMIDDVEDQSLMRRGQSTIHRMFGVPTAINAGNTLYFLPLLSIAEHPTLSVAQRERIYRTIVELFVCAHFGQAQDIYASERLTRGCHWQSTRDYGDVILQTNAFKTAGPVQAIAAVACIIADADAATTLACRRFSETLGVAYQTVDDVNNFCGESEFGKTVGEDLEGGKLTQVIHRALHSLAPCDADRLWSILTNARLRGRPEVLAEGCGLVRKSGALAACRADALSAVEEAWQGMSSCLPPTRAKLMLRLFIAKLLHSREIGN
jgi:geranylgeranyl pyrophosphate synthase